MNHPYLIQKNILNIMCFQFPLCSSYIFISIFYNNMIELINKHHIDASLRIEKNNLVDIIKRIK